MVMRVLGKERIESAPQLPACHVQVLGCPSVLYCRVEKGKSIERNHVGCRGEKNDRWVVAGGWSITCAYLGSLGLDWD